MVGQIIAGAGQPFFLNVPTHYSDKWFSATSRVSATALMSLANAIGAAIGQLVNPFLAPNASDIPNMVLQNGIWLTEAFVFCDHCFCGKCDCTIYTKCPSYTTRSVKYRTKTTSQRFPPCSWTKPQLLATICSGTSHLNSCNI